MEWCSANVFAERDTCFRCDTPRPEEEPPPAPWDCESCKSHNFANRVACFKCGEVRKRPTLAKAPSASATNHSSCSSNGLPQLRKNFGNLTVQPPMNNNDKLSPGSRHSSPASSNSSYGNVSDPSKRNGLKALDRRNMGNALGQENLGQQQRRLSPDDTQSPQKMTAVEGIFANQGAWNDAIRKLNGNATLTRQLHHTRKPPLPNSARLTGRIPGRDMGDSSDWSDLRIPKSAPSAPVTMEKFLVAPNVELPTAALSNGSYESMFASSCFANIFDERHGIYENRGSRPRERSSPLRRRGAQPQQLPRRHHEESTETGLLRVANGGSPQNRPSTPPMETLLNNGGGVMNNMQLTQSVMNLHEKMDALMGMMARLNETDRKSVV